MHKELAKHAFYYKGAIICNCNIFSILSIIFFTFPFLFILIIITIRFVLFLLGKKICDDVNLSNFA